MCVFVYSSELVAVKETHCMSTTAAVSPAVVAAASALSVLGMASHACVATPPLDNTSLSAL